MTLITRLAKLDAPDREVDEEIHDLLCDGKFFSQLADAPLGQGCWMYNFPNGDVSSALHVTSSIDAAIALAERVLPGQARKIVWEEGRAIVVISQATRLHEVAPTIVQTHDHAAIALLIALLRAKEASK
ncbi:hypothetical protein FHS76_000003 [Ochrobactrum daejeonense]|uniref:Uncharacterized protein n=1 Tax=Brucella daejeonensis TaxID=659015 RepID=A0A7W9AT95_9HYPH|nr:hypothetical protein [Brucella daejeonensis]MBB5700165.1 hypothetical protein [Brucella daejeonensis]NKB78527.1 hypothetical protein [Brucella daejeonensis]